MKTQLGFTEITITIETAEEMSVLVHALSQYDAQNGVTSASKTAQSICEQLERIRAKVRELNQIF